MRSVSGVELPIYFRQPAASEVNGGRETRFYVHLTSGGSVHGDEPVIDIDVVTVVAFAQSSLGQSVHDSGRYEQLSFHQVQPGRAVTSATTISKSTKILGAPGGVQGGMLTRPSHSNVVSAKRNRR